MKPLTLSFHSSILRITRLYRTPAAHLEAKIRLCQRLWVKTTYNLKSHKWPNSFKRKGPMWASKTLERFAAVIRARTMRRRMWLSVSSPTTRRRKSRCLLRSQISRKARYQSSAKIARWMGWTQIQLPASRTMSASSVWRSSLRASKRIWMQMYHRRWVCISGVIGKGLRWNPWPIEAA